MQAFVRLALVFTEFALGMQIAHRKMKERIEILMKQGLECDCCSDELKAMFQEWIAGKNSAEVTILCSK